MINLNVLKKIEEGYLKYFPDHFTGNEDYKWIAIKRFQEFWDIESEDFAGMLELSLKKQHPFWQPVIIIPKI